MNNTIVIFLQTLLIYTSELSDLRNVEVKLKIKSLLSKIIGIDSTILNVLLSDMINEVVRMLQKMFRYIPHLSITYLSIYLT